MMNLNCQMALILFQIFDIIWSTSLKSIKYQQHRINNRLVSKIKDGYKLELQALETMKLFGSTKKLINKTKTGENVPSLQVVEVVLIQCNLVENQYQQKSEVLYTFTPSKSYAYLLNAEPIDLVFLKTYNTEFDEIIIKYLPIKMVDRQKKRIKVI